MKKINNVILEDELVDINEIIDITDFNVFNPIDNNEDLPKFPSTLGIYVSYSLKSYYRNNINIWISYAISQRNYSSIQKLKDSQEYKSILDKIVKHNKTYNQFKDYWNENSEKYGLELKRFVTE